MALIIDLPCFQLGNLGNLGLLDLLDLLGHLGHLGFVSHLRCVKPTRNLNMVIFKVRY